MTNSTPIVTGGGHPWDWADLWPGQKVRCDTFDCVRPLSIAELHVVPEPLRACAEIHLAGKQFADRCGDMVTSFSNQQFYIMYLFCCGTDLEKLQPLLKKQIERAMKREQHFASVSAYGVYWASQFLRGQHDEEHPHDLPSWNDLVFKQERGDSNGTWVVLSYQYIQSFLLTKEFRGFPSEGFLNQVLSSNAPLVVLTITGE